MGMRMRATALTLLLCLSLALPLSQAIENANFATPHGEGTFTVGEADIWWVGEDDEPHGARMYYPATTANGTAPPIDNTSGPFPVLIWIGDESEDADNYGWIGTRLASAGIIVLSLPPDWNAGDTYVQIKDIVRLLLRLADNDQNGSFPFDPDNMRDAFDLEHWGVGGHGLGAIQAADAQLVISNGLALWMPHPPRAMIGLGLTLETTFVPAQVYGAAPDPGMGLYLTGTADELSEPSINVERYLEDSEDAWHYLQVVGGNHVQYQDDIGFVEDWLDGDATLSQQEQQDHATDHIIPYLNLMLKGDHASWRDATSRESNWQMPTDSNAYIAENLSTAHFFPIDLPPGAAVTEGEGSAGREVNATLRLTHRDGSRPSNITVRCEVIEGGDWWDSADYSGFGLVESGTYVTDAPSGPWSEANCAVSTEGVPPGNRTLRVSVDWFGMPSFIDIDFFRENRDPVIADPLPVISIPQHGQASLNLTSVASDPDGTALRFFEVAQNQTDHILCSLLVDTLTCEHVGESEWTGSTNVSVMVVDPYGTNSIQIATFQVEVLPVDDPVQQIRGIPAMEMIEDEPTRVLSMAAYFEDPEGAPIVIENATSIEGVTFEAQASTLSITLAANWNGEVRVEMWVSDGTTEPISAFFDLNVASVVDPPRLFISELSLTEDTPIEIPLSELGWDEDGDEVQFRVSGGDGNLSVTVLLEVLRIVPATDWSGVSTGWNITVESGDGSVSAIIDIHVTPFNDPAQVTWGSLPPIEDDAVELIFAVHDPDGALPWDVRYRWDVEGWRNAGTICTVYSSSEWECDVNLSTAQLTPGSHRLSLQIDEGGRWTEEKSYFLLISTPPEESDDPVESAEKTVRDEPFSIWVVAIGTSIAIAAIAGLYMLVALTRDEDSSGG